MRIKEIINSNNSFAVISHANPDGDAVGSSVAMYKLLKMLHKDVIVANESAIPQKYSFLSEYHNFIPLSSLGKSLYDVVFVLDTSSLSLIRQSGFNPHNIGRTVVNIDHHKDNPLFGDYNYVDSSASACGEIIYHIVKETFSFIPCSIAEAIYTAIVTDTGQFSYSNTTPRTHIIISELLKTGIDAHEISRRLFREKRFEAELLLGRLLINMKRTNNNRAVYSILTLKDFQETGATEGDTENIVDQLNNIKGIESAFLLRE
ncbi:MAG: DHH family phosphoesterase, partial [Synergistetes bacterium]|nr:DHH family phosphoesterase [Synergistota bacterium]